MAHRCLAATTPLPAAMRCSCCRCCRRRSRPPPPLLLLPLLAALLAPPPVAAALACPVLGPGIDDPQTKALLAPLVFHGTLTARARRGPALRATFRVERPLKGPPGGARGEDVVVEFAIRENPARCRGAALPSGDEGGGLALQRRYIVFAAWRRKKLIAVAAPEDYSKRKAVNKILCDKCGEYTTNPLLL